MSEVKAITDLVGSLAAQPLIMKDSRGVEWLLRPNATGVYAHHQLTPNNEVAQKPAFVSQTVHIQTVASLIAYVNRFKTENTMIFANSNTDAIVAAIDYHPAAPGGSPALVSHRAALNLTKSNEYDTWTNHDDSLQVQGEFARFVEENRLDIISPDGASLLEMVLDMEKGAVMRVARKMASAGSDRGRKTNDIEITGTDLPPVWSLAFPIYFGEKSVGVTAYVRDKMDDGKLYVGYKLSRLPNIVEAEFARIAQVVGDATSVPVLIGAI